MTGQPTIQEAKDLAYKYRALGCIIVGVGKNNFGIASYGMTRKQCDQLRKLVDAMADLVHQGKVDLSAFKEGA